jgi:hypothetical protein
MVCDGQLQLAQAQRIIATNRVSWAKSHTAPLSTPAPTHTTPPPATTPTSGPDKPIADVNCSDFPTHAAAQQWFEQHHGSKINDVAGLDGNANGLAYESLAKPDAPVRSAGPIPTGAQIHPGGPRPGAGRAAPRAR